MTNRTDRIAELLSKGTASGSVPGVAVAAVFPDGEVVSAAAGVRDMASGAAMRPDTVVWIASMTKAITAAAAMQLVEQGKLSLDAPIAAVLPQARERPGAGEVRRGRDAETAAGARRDHAAASADPQFRLRLRHVERRHGSLSGGDRHARHHLLRQRGAGFAAGVRSRHRLGLRHRHRLGRQSGRGGQRQAAWCVSRGEPVRAAWHARHRVSYPRRSARAARANSCAHAGRDRRDRLRNSADAGIRNGWRRTLRHGRRLSAFRPHDSGRRRAGRRARAGGADRCADEPERHGRTAVPGVEVGGTRLDQRRRLSWTACSGG